jgi:Cu/Ag efflux protein CusF
MKRRLSLILMVLVGLMLTSGAAGAAARKAAKTRLHTITAEVVSVDTAAKTVTIKDDKGATKTITLRGKAVEEASRFKAGDKVMLRVREDRSGEPRSATAVRAAKSSSSSNKA